MALSREKIDYQRNTAAVQAVVNNGLEFSKRFYEVTVKTAPGNFISSPISVSSVLSMLTYGARGETEKRMRTGLNFHQDDNIQRKGLKMITEALNDRGGVELRLANKVFLSDHISIKSEYQELTQEIFRSKFDKLDFSKPEKASKTINDWCDEQTNSKIKNIISPSDITALTRAVLLSAVYFKGQWHYPFSRYGTEDDTFYLEDGSSQQIPTMHNCCYLNYGVLSDVNAKFVELPYRGNNVSMLIILPDKIDGLKDLQKNFVELNLNRLLTEGDRLLVDLALPKFEIETTIDLAVPLVKLGIDDIFETFADMSGMLDGPIMLEKAVQKAYIKVDEFGTEAAACGMRLTGGGGGRDTPPEKFNFHADHPFYYAIIQRLRDLPQTGIVIFQGHYKGPV